MSVDPQSFRAALGHFCSGVTVVTADDGAETRAITASAFTSVSLKPPLVLVCVSREARINDVIHASRRYAVSILNDAQAHVSDRFGRRAEREDFDFEYWNGHPVIAGALLHLAVDVSDIFDGGDHHIYLGHVKHVRMGEGEPLIYFRGRYHRGRSPEPQ